MRFLLPTDGTPHSDATLRFAAQIAAHAEDPPTILTVVRTAGDLPRARAILARAQEILAPQVPRVRLLVRLGPPGPEIVRETRLGAYDLLVIGERVQPSLRSRLWLGSVGRHVLAHAPCPVIVAKGHIRRIHRILLCDSGGDGHSLLTRFTAQLASLLEADEEITVLHVMSQISAMPSVPDRALWASAEDLMRDHTPEGEFLARDLRWLQQPGLHPHPLVRHGTVVHEILNEARNGNHDLVVIGAHRGHGWQRMLLEDLANQIISHLDRPVAVVR